MQILYLYHKKEKKQQMENKKVTLSGRVDKHKYQNYARDFGGIRTPQ